MSIFISPFPGNQVRSMTVTAAQAEQRLDNFLLTFLKGVPKSRVYRMIRKGEVRVNKKRIAVHYRLVCGDVVRVPPVRLPLPGARPMVKEASIHALESAILYEDNVLIVLNKPAGIAVHGGSGVSLGVIEIFRASRPTSPFLELVHRIDRDTSGCLMLAKKRSCLKYLQACLQAGEIKKRYWAIVEGVWQQGRIVEAPLYKYLLPSGERRVRVAEEGKFAKTGIKILESFKHATLLQASPVTGRTHQIRVHCAFRGHPIVGDEKYGRAGEGLFLHAKELVIPREGEGEALVVHAPIPVLFEQYLSALRNEDLL